MMRTVKVGWWNKSWLSWMIIIEMILPAFIGYGEAAEEAW